MKFPKIYFSKKTGNYFIVEDNIKCDFCDKRFNLWDVFTIFYNWRDKDSPEYHYICHSCIKDFRPKDNIDWESHPLILADSQIKGTIPILKLRFRTQWTEKLTIPLANATKDQLSLIEEGKTTYRGKYLYDQNFMKDIDYEETDMKFIEKKDRELSTREGLNVLDSLFSAEILKISEVAQNGNEIEDRRKHKGHSDPSRRSYSGRSEGDHQEA